MGPGRLSRCPTIDATAHQPDVRKMYQKTNFIEKNSACGVRTGLKKKVMIKIRISIPKHHFIQKKPSAYAPTSNENKIVRKNDDCSKNSFYRKKKGACGVRIGLHRVKNYRNKNTCPGNMFCPKKERAPAAYALAQNKTKQNKDIAFCFQNHYKIGN